MSQFLGAVPNPLHPIWDFAVVGSKDRVHIPVRTVVGDEYVDRAGLQN